ncbi:MAG: hypothetical protein KC646_05340 [Candidatus Cloacimonetes bacterium]|nr:hypothetical protein [Candidatus Cloacimonadota bacterium]
MNNYLLIMISLLFIIFGLALSYLNLQIFIQQMRNQHSPSIVPFFGGISLSIGFYTSQLDLVHNYFYLGLFLDYGCAPYTILFLGFVLQQKWVYRASNICVSIDLSDESYLVNLEIYKHDQAILKYEINDQQTFGTTLYSVDWLNASECFICNDTSYIHLQKPSSNWTVVSSKDVGESTFNLNQLFVE